MPAATAAVCVARLLKKSAAHTLTADAPVEKTPPPSGATLPLTTTPPSSASQLDRYKPPPATPAELLSTLTPATVVGLDDGDGLAVTAAVREALAVCDAVADHDVVTVDVGERVAVTEPVAMTVSVPVIVMETDAVRVCVGL